jgi:hypothetical protein
MKRAALWGVGTLVIGSLVGGTLQQVGIVDASKKDVGAQLIVGLSALGIFRRVAK